VCAVESVKGFDAALPFIQMWHGFGWDVGKRIKDKNKVIFPASPIRRWGEIRSISHTAGCSRIRVKGVRKKTL
jgi:hypothetical protein